jgi:hypothetical protein
MTAEAHQLRAPLRALVIRLPVEWVVMYGSDGAPLLYAPLGSPPLPPAEEVDILITAGLIVEVDPPSAPTREAKP